MSREERKMAHIIASIERMEQRMAPTPFNAASTRTETSAESGGTSSSHSSNDAAATGVPTANAIGCAAGLARLNSSEIHAQVQMSAARLGAKGRKLKPLATAHSSRSESSSKSLSSNTRRAKTSQVRAVDKHHCKLTPKKRWIQLWTEQFSSSSDDATMDGSSDDKRKQKDAGGKSDVADVSPPSDVVIEMAAQEPEQEPPQTVANSASRSTELVPAVVSSPTSTTTVDVEVPAAASTAPLPTTTAAAPPPMRSPVSTKRTRPTIEPEEFAQNEGGEGKEEHKKLPHAATAVPMDATLASPSPHTDDQIDSTISPVASVKESLKDATGALAPPLIKSNERVLSITSPSGTTAAVAAVASVSQQPTVAKATRTAVAVAVTTVAMLPDETAATATAMTTNRDDAIENAVTDDATRQLAEQTAPPMLTPPPAAGSSNSAENNNNRKRSLERVNSEPQTAEEKRRAERRRLRKSNWDVGDPRFPMLVGSKPTLRIDDMAFARPFPVGRPAWRHSNSMDATYSSPHPHFPIGPGGLHRSSFSGPGVHGGGFGSGFGGGFGGPPRRGFYASNSLPMDRSRSAGRPFAGHQYANNYR